MDTIVPLSSLWAGECRGMTWSVTTRSSQYSCMSPSDYHLSRLTGRDAFIDQCPILDTEKGSLAAIGHEGSWMSIVHGQKRSALLEEKLALHSCRHCYGYYVPRIRAGRAGVVLLDYAPPH